MRADIAAAVAVEGERQGWRSRRGGRVSGEGGWGFYISICGLAFTIPNATAGWRANHKSRIGGTPS